MKKKELTYYNGNSKNVLAEVTEIAEGLGFTVSISNEEGRRYNVNFAKVSRCGQDFSFDIEVDAYDDVEEICDKIREYMDGYDVSYETYLWLGEDGHGKNGAPYEIIDVYNDMVECKDFIKQLADEMEKYC